jgi:lipoprotein NlpD
MLRSDSVALPKAVFQRGLCVLALAALAACSTRLDQAPVIDRSGAALGTDGMNAAQAAPLGPPPPGYYRVKPGDTLYRIALESGQNYRDIAGWNNLTNPNQIEVDQLLRVAPPGSNPAANGQGVSTAPIGAAGVLAQPLNSTSATGPGPGAAPSANSAPYVPPGPVANLASQPSTPSAAPPAAGNGSISFAWPVHGTILNTFDGSKSKGINIAGNAGDPVRAAGDGRVVYSGNGLRGYGNLIIIKHDATFLTAYAHNRALLVKEGDAVTKGQKIAEMGNSDADRVMLHFEVRRQGKPVDPLKYLPPQ